MSLDLGFFRIPTHSSDYLMMLRLYVLNKLQPDDNAYKSLLKRYYKGQQNEHNPFFNAIYASVYGKSDIDLEKHVNYLRSFPLQPRDIEVINSRNPELKRKFISPIIKNKAVAESVEPLPIYMRPINGLEWKRNPFRMKRNLHKGIGDWHPEADVMDLAASVQAVTEECLTDLWQRASRYAGFGNNNLVYAGGVALNCAANRVLANLGLFEKIWIIPYKKGLKTLK